MKDLNEFLRAMHQEMSCVAGCLCIIVNPYHLCDDVATGRVISGQGWISRPRSLTEPVDVSCAD
jgi:hypothetical protein